MKEIILNEILDKINQHGIDNLKSREINFLKDYFKLPSNATLEFDYYSKNKQLKFIFDKKEQKNSYSLLWGDLINSKGETVYGYFKTRYSNNYGFFMVDEFGVEYGQYEAVDVVELIEINELLLNILCDKMK